MFFQGSLQEGISAALQGAQPLVCFVTDEGEESQQWETEFLADGSVKDTLENHAIMLRLVAGSEEAGYFEAMFPVPRKPTVAVIQGGQLKEYIAGGTQKDDFLRRMGSAVSGSSSQTAAPAAATSVSGDADNLHSEATSSTVPQQASQSGPNPQSQASSSSPGPATPSSAEQRTQDVQAVLAERAKRLEAEKNAQEAKEKAEKDARAKARREVTEQTQSLHPNVGPAERKYAEELKKRKQKEAEDRKRVLKRIEDDKKARKERDAQERQARLLLNAQAGESSATSSGAPASTANIPLATRIPSSQAAGSCNLQVRLFDGTTIRGRFPSDSTLNKDVRGWIDENRTDGDAPYTFRVILPNKSIDSTEEIESLLSLGLTPSATLILVPVARYSSAYAYNGGFIWRSLNYVFDLFVSGVGAVSGTIGMILGGGRRQAQAFEAVPLQNIDRDGNTGDQDEARRRNQQFYNGNSLSFEPRNDEDDEEAET